MKYKVGDKVRQSDKWEASTEWEEMGSLYPKVFSGVVVIVDVEDDAYPYYVRLDEDDRYPVLFAEEELEATV